MADEQSQGVQDLNDKIDAMILEGAEENERWQALWRDAQNYIFNNQLAGRDMKKGWERIQVNYIYPAVQQQIAMMAQRKPLIVGEPWEESDIEGAAFWEPVLQWQFEHDLDLGLKASAATLDAQIYGFYVGRVDGDEKAYWDVDEQRWHWRPRVSLICPEYHFADPECESLDDAAYEGTHRRVKTAWALDRWPKFKKEIEEAAQESKDGQPAIAFLQGQLNAAREDEQDPGTKGGKEDGAEGRLVSLLRRVREGPTMATGEDPKKGVPRYVTLTEIFFRDGTEIPYQEPAQPIPVEDLLASGQVQAVGGVYYAAVDGFIEGLAAGEPIPDGFWPMQPGLKRKVPQFPRGRRVLRVGKTILNPKPEDQVWPYTRWPFVVGVNEMLPHLWRGMNGVEPAKGLQDWINVSAAHMCAYVKYFGDPVVLVERGAVEGCPDNKNIATKLRAMAGAIWSLTKGGIGKIKRDAPPPLAAAVLQLYQLFTREIQDQLGSHDVSRGRQGKGQTTAFEIGQLAQTSRTRAAWAAQMQDIWIQRIMSLVAEFDQANMQPGEMVRVAGEQHRGTAMVIPEGACDVRFDVKLRVGTELPHDQEKRKVEYTELFKMIGIPVLPELLDAYKVQNKAEVLARVQAWQMLQQFMAEQEAMAQQAEAGEPVAQGA